MTTNDKPRFGENAANESSPLGGKDSPTPPEETPTPTKTPAATWVVLGVIVIAFIGPLTIWLYRLALGQ